jgi:two-component system chemotaxis response regulator CheB
LEIPSSREIKVLVVDDSALMRTLISDMLSADSQIKVVDTAKDGMEAIQKAIDLKPDVITLDVEMPRLNGLGALKQISRVVPSRVIVVTGLDDVEVAVEALRLGALDVVIKPSGTFSVDIEKIKDELIRKVKIASISREIPVKVTPSTTDLKDVVGIIVIGASTGGPRALDIIFSTWSPDIPLPVVVVQHLPDGFCHALARNLSLRTKLRVSVPRDGEVMQPGEIYLAPGGVHLKVKEKGKKKVLRYDDGPPQNGVKPSADITMISAAQIFGPATIGILLTGSGHDGALGMRSIKEAGGKTFVQDKESCAVFGMPKSAIQMGAADKILPPEKISFEVEKEAHRIFEEFALKEKRNE